MNNFLRLLRKTTRYVGINKFLASFFYPSMYEESFEKALLKQIRPGDIVWDVGANVGLYSTKFSDITGPSGLVYAFEPVPETYKILEKQTKTYKNIKKMNFGLASKKAILTMEIQTDVGNPTNKIIDESKSSNLNKIEIKAYSADSLICDDPKLSPNVIKIDVEGYELDVLLGMNNLLTNLSLKAVGIEIHFAILEENGNGKGVKSIVTILKNNNFKLKWLDPSHIIAVR